LVLHTIDSQDIHKIQDTQGANPEFLEAKAQRNPEILAIKTRIQSLRLSLIPMKELSLIKQIR